MQSTQRGIKIPKGTLILFSRDEYADFIIGPLFRTLFDLDIKELEKECVKEHPGKDQWSQAEDPHFYKWIAEEKGFVEKVDCVHLNIGSYGKLNLYADEL